MSNELAPLEKAFNSLLEVTAKRLEIALMNNDWLEVERVIKLLKKGLQ